MQKSLLLGNLRDLYIVFKTKFPTEKFDIHKFCSLKLNPLLDRTAKWRHSFLNPNQTSTLNFDRFGKYFHKILAHFDLFAINLCETEQWDFMK